MTSRLLPREEWHKLAGTEADALWPTLPDAARVVVVEDARVIVGCHVLVPILHAECLWIHPDHRGKTSVARRLWAAVQRTARETFGAQWFATAAMSEEVRGLLAHVQAVQVPGDHYMVPVRGERCQ